MSLLMLFITRYPTSKWVKLGTFHARDERTVQSFPLDEQLYAKYVKVSLRVQFRILAYLIPFGTPLLVHHFSCD